MLGNNKNSLSDFKLETSNISNAYHDMETGDLLLLTNDKYDIQSIRIVYKDTAENKIGYIRGDKDGDGHLKNYGILYDKDFQDASLAPIYDVITTTIYFQKDIPALKISDGKLWWKEKTYKNFAKQSCALTNKEYKVIIKDCKNAITKAKIDIDI